MKAGEGGYPGTIYTSQEILNLTHLFDALVAGGKSLSDASQGVALATDQPCRYVLVYAYGGILAVGNDSSVRADSSATGAILTPGSRPAIVLTSNLNRVFVSGASGTRACYLYYNA